MHALRIAVLKVVDAVSSVLAPSGQLVVLIKPQFEAGKAQVGAGGVVRDPSVHKDVIKKVVDGFHVAGFECSGWMESPIKGATGGNTEFLAHFTRRVDGGSRGGEGSLGGDGNRDGDN
jgi:23S rRNA (cytidine1920-2'-O)/16S rRNA (cytidine1409-2'-O)-methyltransferase